MELTSELEYNDKKLRRQWRLGSASMEFCRITTGMGKKLDVRSILDGESTGLTTCLATKGQKEEREKDDFLNLII